MFFCGHVMSQSEVKLGFIEIPQAQPQPLNICGSGLWDSGRFAVLTSQLHWNFSCKNRGSKFVASFIFSEEEEIRICM